MTKTNWLLNILQIIKTVNLFSGVPYVTKSVSTHDFKLLQSDY